MMVVGIKGEKKIGVGVICLVMKYYLRWWWFVSVIKDFLRYFHLKSNIFEGGFMLVFLVITVIKFYLFMR